MNENIVQCPTCQKYVYIVNKHTCCGNRLYTPPFIEKPKKARKTEVVNGKRRKIYIKKPKKLKRSRPKIDKTIKEFVLKRDKQRCTKCRTKESLHVHHIKHRVDGGTDEPSNLTTLCDMCHAEEHRGEPVYNIMIKRLMQVKVV